MTVDLERVLALFEDISCHQPDDVPRLMKRLEQQWQRLKGQDLSGLTHAELNTIAKQGSKAYFSALTSAKLTRASHKVIKCFPKRCEDELQRDLAVSLENLLTSTEHKDIKTLSLLLDQNQDAKCFVKSQFEKFSQLVKTALCTNVLSLSEQDAREYLHCGAKLCIQALQLCKTNVQHLLETCPSTTEEKQLQSFSNSGKLYDCWEQIVLVLVTHLTQSHNRDYLLLVGTALAMVLNCAPSLEMTQVSYMEILSLLAEERSNFHFCGIQYQQVTGTQRDNFLPVIAMVKGLLVSCEKDTLKSGLCPLIFQVFPRVLNFCKGPTSQHYLSFQVLALWSQKLGELGALRPSSACLQSIAVHVRNESQDFESSETNSSNLKADMQMMTGQISSPGIGDKKDFSKRSTMEETGRDSGCSQGPCYMTSYCPFLLTILDCIWLNWDSPVDGVSEYVLEIFRRLLKIWWACVEDGSSNYSSLCQELFERVVSMAWHSRTRYKPLSLLLPYIDCEKALSQYPRLKDELLLCMKTTHLAAVASDTYKAFLQHLSSNKKKEALAKDWETLWMSVLISGLTSEHVSQRLKVSTYWLEPTLTLVPPSRGLLLSHLGQLSALRDQTRGSHYDQMLYAWTVVSRMARENFQTCNQLQREDLLQAALSSDDDLIRGEAFHLLASTLRKSEPVSEMEIKLLREFVPYNLKTDSASFRHTFTSSIRKVLVRVRDSCLSNVRLKKTDSLGLKQGLAFVDWLYELLMLSLAPGSSYHRRQTTFDLLFALLETLMYQEESTARKGKANETADVLFKFAQNEGQWNFFSSSHFLKLLICLEDGAEEVQNQSYKILTTYFKWPTKMDFDMSLQESYLCTEDSLQLVSKSSFAQQLMDRAFHLISRPRAYENHSGLLLLSLVLDRYVIGHHMVVTVHQTQPHTFLLGPPQLPSADDGGRSSVVGPAFELLDLLISNVESSLEAVATDVAANVKIHPIHGILQCINKCHLCISHHIKKREIVPDNWSSKLENVIRLSYRVIDFILDVLAGGKSIVDCPSFADIGSALENLVSGDEEQDDASTTLSPEFQLLLSWCWINLKESCTCLAGVTSTSLLSERTSHLDKAVLQSVGEKFIMVLTKCRHRGAIEGCRSGLYQFSISLMSSKIVELAHIPRVILQMVLGSLSENSLTSSVTRRSAGLPIIVQTILQAACRCGHVVLLESTVGELYSFASEPLPESHSQQHDLRQSHALNILKAIFCDSSLAPRLTSLLSKVVVLVIEGFDSPSWAIRNAATQLISTLVTRIFGQKSKINPAGSMSLGEFAALYPELLQYVCSKLKAYTEVRETLIRPSLYVMLTLLANIGPVPSHQLSVTSRYRSFLQKAAEFFLASPVYSLRKLAAQVWISLCALDEADFTLQEILQHLLEEKRTGINALHGWLLCSLNIFSLGQLSPIASLAMIKFYVANRWLVTSCSSCLLVASLVMQSTQLALSHVGEISPDLLTEVWSLAESCMAFVCSNTKALQVAKDHCIRDCIRCSQIICNTQGDSESKVKFENVLENGLTSNIPEVRAEVLDCLLEGVSNSSLILSESLQCMLWRILLSSSHSQNFMKAVEILLVMRLKNQLKIELAEIERVEKVISELQCKGTLCLRKAVFDLKGIIIGISSTERLVGQMRSVQELCALQVEFSCPTANETLRLSAGSALRTCGAKVIDICNSHKNPEYSDACLVNIVKTSLTLLEDTEDDVRKEALLFIRDLCNRAKMHYVVAFSALSEFVADRLFWSGGLCSFLLEILYKEGDIRNAVAGVSDSETQVLFEAETCSAMSEKHVSQIWAFVSYKNMMLKHPEVCSQRLRNLAPSVATELCSVMPDIHKNLDGQSIFIYMEESVFSAFLGLILLGHLCERVMKDTVGTEIRSGFETLTTAVAKLHKAQVLHPFLQRRHHETDELVICDVLNSRSLEMRT